MSLELRSQVLVALQVASEREAAAAAREAAAGGAESLGAQLEAERAAAAAEVAAARREAEAAACTASTARCSRVDGFTAFRTMLSHKQHAGLRSWHVLRPLSAAALVAA